MRYKSRTRALAGAALAATLGLAGLAFTASPAMAVEETDVVRVAGTTRYGTAADAATSAYPAGSANVVLASGEKFPDALAGGGLAGSLDAPILLTLEDSLPADTIAALAELGAETVTILGGTDAVSAAVEAELVALGYGTDRVAGLDRFETAADIATQLGGTTAVLANGLRFPDALAISPGAHALELPVLLTVADSLHEDAAAYIDANAVDTVIIVGGTAVVSQDIEDALEADGITVTRLAGDTRYESSIEIAEFHVTQGFTLDRVAMATGEDFADALAGGPYAAQMGAPMVLTQTATLTPSVATWLAENCQEIDALSILGGTAAITTEVENEAAAAAQCDVVSNQSFAVTPDTAMDLEHDGAVGAATPTDDRTFTVSGLTDGTTYRIALFPGANVTIDDDGVVTFRDVDGSANLADGEGDTSVASIVRVNNAVVTATGETTATPVSGTVTFTIDGSATGTVVPVIYVDADSDTNLDLGADDQPSEDFGVGGATRYLPAEGAGASSPGLVSLVDKDGDFFVAANGTYFYDANDAYQIGGVPSTLAAFEAALSSGDTVTGTYAPDPDAVSQFNLTDDNPGTPTIGTATQDGNAVDLTWTAPAGDVDSYNIYRALSANNTDCTANAAASYSLLDSDTASPYEDTSVTVPEQYCYTVAAVNDGDEGARSGAAFVSLTAVDAAAPTIQDVQATVDAGVVGLMDDGDSVRFIFSEPMNASVAADNSLFRVADADGTTVDVVCAGDVGTDSCTLNAAAVTIDGTVYPANQVMTVTVADATVNAVSAGTIAGVSYPATITNVNSQWDDAAGNQLDLAGSPDRTIEN